MLATTLSDRSVGVLLRVMEMQTARAQGAVLRLMGQREADKLIDSRLVVEDGVIPIVVMMDDYEDEPVAAEWSPELRAYGYREKSGRWVVADPRDIAAFKVDFERTIASMLVQFDRGGSPQPKTLVEGYLLDLGAIRLAGADKPVPVWFARCLGTPEVWQKIAGYMERRPAVGPRLILTSTRGERISPSLKRRDVIVAVSDVFAGPGSLAISPEILDARVFPAQMQRRHPIDHSEDYGIVWLKEKQIAFRGDKKCEALRQLFTAYWSGSPRLRTAAVLEEAGYGAKVNTLPKAFGETGDWRLFIKYADGYCWIET
jgi:hypothetical protein